MLSAEAVSYWIRQGQIPAHWRVVRGSASLGVRSFLLTCVLTQVIGMGLGTVLGLIINLYSHEHFDPLALITQITLLLTMDIVCLFLRASTARGSIIVFLPEGCLQFTDINTGLSYTDKVMWFAQVADIQLRINFWIWSYLLIRTYDGGTLKWRADPCFGPSGKTLQEILVAYTRYQMLNPPRPAQVGHTHYGYSPSSYETRMG